MGLFDNLFQWRKAPLPLTPSQACMGMMIVAYQSLFSLFPFMPLFKEDYGFLLGYVDKAKWMEGDGWMDGINDMADLIEKPNAVLRGVTNRIEGAKALELFATCIPVSLRNHVFAWYAQLVFDEDKICTEPMDDEHRSWSLQAMEMVRGALGVNNTLSSK